MIINDPENLIPDHSHLRRLIHRHPLDADLGTRIAKVTILRSERCGIAQENINIDANGNVSLGVGEATCHKQDYDFIILHEFSDVVDRLCPEFQYSEEMKQPLSDSERTCLMEIWNLYINSRLNQKGLYVHSGSSCLGTLNGQRQVFPASAQGDLMAHISILERKGFPYNDASQLVERIWKDPPLLLTYPEMIDYVKNGRGE